MREYHLPPDVNKEEEKAVGGVLTFKQTAWIALGIILIMGFSILIGSLTNNVPVAIVLSVFFGIWTIPMAFKKKFDQSLLSYFRMKVKHLKKTHRLINQREVR